MATGQGQVFLPHPGLRGMQKQKQGLVSHNAQGGRGARKTHWMPQNQNTNQGFGMPNQTLMPPQGPPGPMYPRLRNQNQGPAFMSNKRPRTWSHSGPGAPTQGGPPRKRQMMDPTFRGGGPGPGPGRGGNMSGPRGGRGGWNRGGRGGRGRGRGQGNRPAPSPAVSSVSEEVWPPRTPGGHNRTPSEEEKNNWATARLQKYGKPVAPINTTQFIINDHDVDEPNYQEIHDSLVIGRAKRDSESKSDNQTDQQAQDSENIGGPHSEFYSSPEDEEEYMKHEFAAMYEESNTERLTSLSHNELVQEYINLEGRCDELERQLKESRKRSTGSRGVVASGRHRSTSESETQTGANQSEEAQFIRDVVAACDPSCSSSSSESELEANPTKSLAPPNSTPVAQTTTYSGPLLRSRAHQLASSHLPPTATTSEYQAEIQRLLDENECLKSDIKRLERLCTPTPTSSISTAPSICDLLPKPQPSMTTRICTTSSSTTQATSSESIKIDPVSGGGTSPGKSRQDISK